MKQPLVLKASCSAQELEISYSWAHPWFHDKGDEAEGHLVMGICGCGCDDVLSCSLL